MILDKMFKLSVISGALVLAACGGSDDKPRVEKLIQESPIVSITPAVGKENQLIEVKAHATDPDGSISSFKWEVTSNHSIELIGDTTETVSFTAPSVTESVESITLKVTVTDNDGLSAESDVTVAISNVIPQISIENLIVDEKALAKLAAEITSEEEIVNYLWEKTSGPEIFLQGEDTPNVEFIAPEVSENTIIGLKLTITDIDGDSVSSEISVNVNQLTIPLKINGLATDSPISNAKISVHVAGRDLSIDVNADQNGVYSIDLLLDDSEIDAFVSIVAQGIETQENAGLISLLGTLGHLKSLAGNDDILEVEDDFSVNVTNVTTAKYALAKLANNGKDITSDEELEKLFNTLDYEDVLTLATAIKVAIDKAANNTNLTLPDEVSNTLELVENIPLAKQYVAKVIDEPEFKEALLEISNDGSLFDSKSSYSVPDVYYVLSSRTFTSGFITRFENNNGSIGDQKFTWTEESGVISATIEDPKISTSFQYFDSLGKEVEVENSTISHEFKRLNSGVQSDVILKTTVHKTHYPNGEFTDELTSESNAYNAIKASGLIRNTHQGSGVAYLSFPGDKGTENLQIMADEFILNADGSGNATLLGFDFTWKMNDGSLELTIPAENENDRWVARWTQLTEKFGANYFAHEFIVNGEINKEDDFVGKSSILKAPLAWSNNIAGIYSYSKATFSNPNEHLWFELHANGDADTKFSFDLNADGAITEDELIVHYGKWRIESNGSLVITRVRNESFDYVSDCRDAATEGCTLYHERTWQLIGQNNNEYNVFHKHDFKLTNFPIMQQADYISYDNRSVFKINSAPIELVKGKVNKVSKSILNRSIKFNKLEPQHNIAYNQ